MRLAHASRARSRQKALSHKGRGDIDASTLFSPLPSWERVDRRFSGEPGEGMIEGMQSPCRDASASGFWGERRAEKRKPMVSAILTDHGGRLSARHTRRWSAAGPALRCRRNAGRSASSWQGLIVVPEGAPSRPGALACETRPAGAAPHPAFTTPRDDAPQRMRWPECKGGAAGGDKFSLRHTGESRYPVRRDAEGIYHHRRLHGLLDARLRGHDND
jgi:hypothetical protein